MAAGSSSNSSSLSARRTNAVDSHYAVLQCDVDASLESIRAQYRRLILQTHPDKAISTSTTMTTVTAIATTSDTASAAFQRIHTAWQVLSDETLRRDYDRHLRGCLFCDRCSLNDLDFNSKFMILNSFC